MSLDMGPALLFCPADRPERFAGALQKADAVILDLEDAVLPAAKAQARENIAAAVLDPERVIVRVNAPDTADFAKDLDVLARTSFRRVMVAKSENPGMLDAFRADQQIIALCETALGVHRAGEIAAHERTVALMWGAEDLVASLGGLSSRFADGRYRDVARQARAQVLLAAGAYGRTAIDAVHLDIDDVQGLAEEAADAVASGFGATACIHPKQVAVIREAYRPDAATVDWARAVLVAAEGERGVFRFEGRMIDEPVLRHARAVVERGMRIDG
ncbi:HpcH/HpaI aldolase/citrate lyase family protein [Microbacterium esteraromaticum]|uniref:HpcH/HpaI aldolase/citrate lyase family protein n=1 Tax=Microbacterium esteraromaticum TaxID=57043 RepID=UPI0019D385B1|nr:CoA ester lyase [Microbacterium esteraromaticum]MBN7792650.1 CoA ester lyase [Microbacterium esteraromaticum]